MMAWIRTAWATAWRTLTVMLRAYPWSFTIGVLLATLSYFFTGYVLWRFVHQGRISTTFTTYAGTNSYLAYIAVGLACYQFARRTVLSLSRALITELREGTLEVLLLSPVNRWSYFTGHMLVNTVTTAVEMSLLAVVAMLLGVRLVGSFSAVVASLAVSLYGLFGFAVLVGVFMLYSRDTYVTQNTLHQIVFLTSGAMFPRQYLPEPLQFVATLLPTSPALDLLRGTLVNGWPLAQQVPALLHTFGLGSLYLTCSILLLPKLEKHVIIHRNP